MERAMAAAVFEATLRRQSLVTIIDLQGDLDAHAQTKLLNAYTQAERILSDTILLNFSRVTYINSAGVSLVIELLARAQKGRRRIAAHSLSSHYTKIFQITRLIDHMTVYRDEESALADIQGNR
jgi:anti-sigma B factor antagonist